MTHAFELQQEMSLAASPEQVWEAIATGPGVDSWFMGRNEIEPHEGGATRMSIGGQVEEATVTTWEPGRRFAYRSAPGDDGTFMAFDFLIEGRGGARTSLRLVQSGMLGDDWETEYEAMTLGWAMYTQTLVAYLEHFAGRTATPLFGAVPLTVTPDAAWSTLTKALGLSGPVSTGDEVRCTPDGLAPIAGVVDCANLPTFLGVRTADGLYRFLHSGPDRGNVMILGHHIFTPGVDAEATERAWQTWAIGLFA